MKRLILLAALATAACQPQDEPVAITPPEPVAYGMSDAEAEATVLRVLAENGCSMSFNDYQSRLDDMGLSPDMADPTIEPGRLTLAKRRILEIAIQEMAEAGVLRRSGWTFTSNTGACA